MRPSWCGTARPALRGRFRDRSGPAARLMTLTGCGAAWLARLTGGQEVGSSNLPSPTGTYQVDGQKGPPRRWSVFSPPHRALQISDIPIFRYSCFSGPAQKTRRWRALLAGSMSGRRSRAHRTNVVVAQLDERGDYRRHLRIRLSRDASQTPEGEGGIAIDAAGCDDGGASIRIMSLVVLELAHEATRHCYDVVCRCRRWRVGA
jgi:hypothetical protein